MALSETDLIDVYSFTWKAVLHLTRTELSNALETLEQRNIEQRDADFLRGRISLAREILDLPTRGSEHVSE